MLAKQRSYKMQKKILALIAVTLLVFVNIMPVFAAEGYDQVASSSEVSSAKSVSRYGMIPIYASDIKDGMYNVKMDSSSSFFHIVSTELTVKEDKMKAVILIGSSSYKCVYPGAAEEAAKAPLEDYIMAEETDLGTTFEIPVEALNKELPLAAFSKKKKKWYDRVVLINASSLPEDAVSFKVPGYDRIQSAIDLYDQENGTDTRAELEEDEEPAGNEESTESGESESGGPEPVDVKKKDGTYSIEVALTGGSGRASVSSPTWLIVKGGKAYARLLWSSSYYDYMIVGGKKYLNESKNGGNSTFTVPITQFDEPMDVIADTTSMGDPVAIAYTLTFYEDTINSSSKIPQEAAKSVIIIAAIVAIVGGILNYIIKAKKEKKAYRKRK